MIKIAVPNKGSLSESAISMLEEAGYRVRTSTRQLVLEDPENGVQFFYLRPRDIATYVGLGTLDAGITGLDLLLDAHSGALETQKLGFAKSTFRFATPKNAGITNLADLNGKRIATSYAVLLADFLQKNAVKADIVKLDGAVESSIDLGVADAIADVVSTGTTLKQAGLEIFAEPILQSEALLIRSPKLDASNKELATLIQRLKGVITARNFVLMDYNVPNSRLEEAIKITPGTDAPTISPLGRFASSHMSINNDQTGGEVGSPALGNDEWSAVRVMVKKSEVNAIMDALWEVGARAILTTIIHASRI